MHTDNRLEITVNGPRFKSASLIKRGIATKTDPNWTLEEYLSNYKQMLNTLYNHEVLICNKVKDE